MIFLDEGASPEPPELPLLPLNPGASEEVAAGESAATTRLVV